MAFLLIVTYTLFLFNNAGIYQTEIIPVVMLELVPIFFFPLIISYILDDQNVDLKKRISRFALLFILAITLRFLIILASPDPIIDVFVLLKEAPVKLLQGQNPYTIIFPTVYPGVTNIYPYMPLSFLAQAPFVLIFHDPRVLLVLSDVISAYLVYLISKKKTMGEVLALIYLYRPNSIFITEQSWLVNFEFLFLIASLYFFVKTLDKYDQVNNILSGFFLTCLFMIKIHYLPILLFFIIGVKKIKPFILGLPTLIILIFIPFLIWNFPIFLIRTVGSFGNSLSYPFSMSLNTAVLRLTGSDIPIVISMSLLFILLTVLVYNLVKKRNKNIAKLSDTILAITIFYLFFNLLFKFSFINQYYFIGSCVILWVASITRENEVLK